MSFLSPAFLWALPVAAVPLVVHLINRRKPKRVAFSYLALLRQADRTLMPRKRLQEWLLLLLRTLFVLALIFFFSRPVLRTEAFLPQGEKGGAMVVLFDVSASMGAIAGGQSAVEIAKARFQPVLRRFTETAKVGLIAYSDQVEVEVAPIVDRSKIAAAVSGLKVAPRPTDIEPALTLAYRMLENQNASRKTILILSDFAANGWAALGAGAIPGYDPAVAVVAWEAVAEVDNAGISRVSLDLRESGILRGGWRGHGEEDAVGRSWRFSLNDRILGRGRVESGAFGAGTPIQARLGEGGAYFGRIQIDEDALAFDDTFWLAGRISKGFRLLLVDGQRGVASSDAETYYLQLALENPRDPRLLAMKVIRPEGLPAEDLNAVDVIVLANAAPGSQAKRLRAWTEEGGGLLMTAGPNWSPSGGDIAGLFQIGDRVTANVGMAPSGEVGKVLADDAGLGGFEWSQVEVRVRHRISPASDLSAILQLETGEPLLVRKKVGKGHAALLATSLDRSWTNFPAKPAFAPLVRELIAFLADPDRDRTSLVGAVGAPFSVRVPDGVRAVTVVAPSGNARTVTVGANGLLSYTAEETGLIRVETGRPADDFFLAANVAEAADEGRTERVTRTMLAAAFPRANLTWVSAGDGGGRGVLAALDGRELTVVLIVLAILLFLAESWVARPKIARAAVSASILLMLIAPVSFAGEGNRYVFAQLRHDGAWDPYPQIHEAILDFIVRMTNIDIHPERKVLSLLDADLFGYPFLIVKGDAALRFSGAEKKRLKQYVDRGGLIFFDDTLAQPGGPFAASIRETFKELYPARRFERMPPEHALYRSFFLLRNAAGRRIARGTLEALDVGGESGGEGRTAVIYCPNDLLGAWMKDRLGQYVYACEPGGEPQRWESFKLTLNLVYFALTGTYKKDAVHQPFIEQKLGS